MDRATEAAAARQAGAPPAIPIENPAWLRSEIIVLAPNGGWWHRGGKTGIYARVRDTGAASGDLFVRDGALRRLVCIPGGIHCAAVEASLAAIAADRVQGYYISPPLEIEAFAEFLAHYRPAEMRDQQAA